MADNLIEPKVAPARRYSMVLIPLVQNMALIIVMALLHQQLYWRLPSGARFLPILSGFMFGLVGILGMLNPFMVTQGFYYDGRTIVLTVAGVFGGPVSAGIAAVMCATYRLAQGGAGAVPAATGMAIVVAMGSAYHFLATTKKIKRNTLTLGAIGLLVHAAMLALQFTVPGRQWRVILPVVAPIMLTAYPLVFLIISLIFIDKEKQHGEHLALLASEDRYRTLFEKTPAAMLLIEKAAGKIMDANGAAEKFYGWKREEFKEMKLCDIEIRRARPGPNDSSIREHRTRSGQAKFVEVLEDAPGSEKSEFYHAIVQDISFKEMEAMDKNVLYEAINKSFNEIYIFDAENYKFVYLNRGAVSNLKYEPETLRSMTPLDLKKEMKPEVFEAILDSLRSGEKPMAVFRTEHFRSDGSKYPVEIKLQYFDEAENKVFLAIVSDITESVEAEKAIAEMNADLERRVKERTILLEQANAELESFSYSISHDLRTPLRAIDNFSSLLEDKLGDAVDEDCRHYLSRIHGGILKMSRLIDDLLKLSRIGRQAVDLRDIDLAETAREVVKELQAEEPDRNVAISIPARLPGRGDKALAKILMENLLGNAWKFSSQKEEAHIEIGEINPGQPRDGWFIRDDGAGFDERQSSMLFIPFHRLHTEREFSGTGIGLSIAHRIVVRHGGRIWAESKPGEGACFYFTLGESSTGG